MCGGGVELCSDRVQCAMRQSMWKGSRDVSEICGKASETYWRYIGKSMKVDHRSYSDSGPVYLWIVMQ